MTADHDVNALTRRIDHLAHAAARIRTQLADLHSIAYEPSTATDPGDRVRGGQPDRSPRSGPDVAKHLWNRTSLELTRCEDILVGLERAITGWFMVSAAIEPSRGSLIPASEHDRLLKNQRARAKAGEYTPTRLVDQPTHPGRRP